VVNAAAEVDDAGTVRHNGNLRLTLGAPRPPDHEDALETIVQALRDCGIDARATSTIRAAVWTKLQNNLASAPAGVLTGATMGPLIEAPGMALLRERLMRECLAVAHAYGVDLIDDIAARACEPSPAPNHKPSMLQDYEAGRPLEIDAQITAVAELAERRQVAVPLVETLLALVRLKSSTIVGATDNHAER
jgi:2-dehydropantoate 2-reductase